MTRSGRPRKLSRWLAAVAIAVGFGLSAGRCARDVPLGVDPGSDAAALDGAGSGDGGAAD